MHIDKSIDIYDVYKISPVSESVTRMYGTWRENNGIHITDPDIWSRRGSLEGHHIR